MAGHHLRQCPVLQDVGLTRIKVDRIRTAQTGPPPLHPFAIHGSVMSLVRVGPLECRDLFDRLGPATKLTEGENCALDELVPSAAAGLVSGKAETACVPARGSRELTLFVKCTRKLERNLRGRFGVLTGSSRFDLRLVEPAALNEAESDHAPDPLA